MISRRSIIHHGATAALLAGTAVAAVQCGPTEAPAAEADRFLVAMTRYNAEVAAYNSGDDIDNDEDFSIHNGIWDRLFSEPGGMPVPITSDAGALAALDRAIPLIADVDGEADALMRHVQDYLSRRASE